MTPIETEKALRYLASLDAARCDGNWAELTELARKVEKHAPHRKCLAQTARTEAFIAQAIHTDPTTTPIVDISILTASIESLPEHLPEDAFDAAICVGWVHALLQRPDEALAGMPAHISQTWSSLPESVKVARRWLQIGAIKGAYIIGQSHEKLSDTPSAIQAYGSVLPLLNPAKALPEGQAWSLRLLSRLCELTSQPGSSKTTGEDMMLGTFRRWAAFWATSSSTATRMASTTTAAFTPIAGSDVWLAYYRALTDLLAAGLACDPTAAEFEPHILARDQCTSTSEFSSARAKLRAELRQVGTAYESFLHDTTAFPHAGSQNTEVVKWVEAVMSHWRAECGVISEEIVEIDGGINRTREKIALSNHTLQILYRAASKTFQSSSILRHLFTVHAYLTEFPLAIRAFDSYVDISTRARERTIRTGLIDPSHDDDCATIWTFSSAIEVLAKFGDASEAEKASVAGSKLAELLGTVVVPNENRALGLRAIGLSKAHWARWTTDEKARSDLQETAIWYLSQSLDPELNQDENPHTLFEYSLVLAEVGSVPPAIQAVRQALLAVQQAEDIESQTHIGNLENLKSRSIARHVRLVPLWHLLSLLLSAGEDFSTALKTCNASFEVLGVSSRTDLSNIASLYMNDCDKEDLIELKMTQIDLIERSEGVSVALDSLDNLLYLFIDLFGSLPNLSVNEPHSAPPDISVTSSSAGRTSRIRSLRRPFSRPDSHAPPRSQDGSATSEAPHRFLSRLSIYDSLPRSDRSRLSTRLTGRRLSRSRTGSAGGASNLGADELGMIITSGAVTSPSNPSTVTSPADPTFIPAVTLDVSNSASAIKPASNIEPNLTPWLSQSLPKPVFPPSSVERRKIAILIRIWLFVARLFIQSGMHDNAAGALHDAAELCTQLEADALRQSMSAESVASNGRWLSIESVDELWADISVVTGSMMVAQDLFFDAQDAFELALSRYPNHCEATVHLSHLLLDMYEGIIPLERPERTPEELPRLLSNVLEIPVTAQILDFPSVRPGSEHKTSQLKLGSSVSGRSNTNPSAVWKDLTQTDDGSDRDPIVSQTTTKAISSNPNSPKLVPTASVLASDLHKLAARDRAYNLLSTLIRRPIGWNTAEAWFALGRASKASGDLEKAKNQFWWCVGLEERAPVRRWTSVSSRRV